MEEGALTQRRQEVDPEMLGNPQDDECEEHDKEQEPLLRSPREDSFLSHGGLLATSVLLCKAAIGAGVLSLPAYGAEVGFSFLLLMLLVGALLTILSIYMIGEACVATSRWSFEDISEELYSPALSFFTGLVNAFYCVFCSAAYLVVFGQAFQVLTGVDQDSVKYFQISIGLAVCLPLALAKHVNFLRYLSLVGVAGLFGVVVVVGYLLARYGAHPGVTATTFVHGTGTVDAVVYVNAITSIIMALNNQFNVPQITGEIRGRSVERVTRVALVSMGSVFLLYATVAALGVLTFGMTQKETIVLELGNHRTDFLVKLALVAVSFSTLISFELNIYPVRQFLAYCVRKFRGRDANEDEADDANYAGMSLTRWLDIICASTVVVVAIILAVSLESVRMILIIAGSTAASYISYIVPPLWSLKIRSLNRDGARGDFPCLWVAVCYAMITLGVSIMIFGLYAAAKTPRQH